MSILGKKAEEVEFFEELESTYKKDGFLKFFVSDFVKNIDLSSFCEKFSFDLGKEKIKFMRIDGIYYIFAKQHLPKAHTIFITHLKNYLEKLAK